MNIYYLASIKENTISGTKRHLWEKTNKETILKKCWISLQQSIAEDDRIFIIDSNLPSELLNWMYDTSQGLVTQIQVPKTKEPYQFLLTALDTLEENINDRSHFIVEDDYLFVYDALPVIKECLQHWHSFGTPDDNPQKYLDNIQESFVYVGNDRHWRSINTSGWSVFGNSMIWKNFINLLKENSKTNNYEIFNNIFRQTPSICPLPGVATHLKEGHMTPLINWTEIWKEIKV